MARELHYTEMDLSDKSVETKAVSKTVKGGRIRRMTALVVVGDKNGHVGYGLGKAAEVRDAKEKALTDAKKNLIRVSLKDGTIPHEIIGRFGAGKVILKPAAEGTGIIAGGAVRTVLELVGVRNVRSKCLRSSNSINVVKATFDGLQKLRTAEEVARARGKSVESLQRVKIEEV